MITNISLATVFCLDQDQMRDFYITHLGFEPRTDISMGEGFRWVTIGHPSQSELDVALMLPCPPLAPDAADFIRRQLEKGEMAALGRRTDDCHMTFRELSAKGVRFLQEPADRPDGIGAIMRDNSGDWMVMVEPREFSPEDSATEG